MSNKNTNEGADCGYRCREHKPAGLLPDKSLQALAKSMGVVGGYTSTFEDDLDTALGKIKELLLAKNKAYGDAALNPLRFHSSASPVEQLNVRMDDKLSRMARGGKSGEDEPLDYVGYWVLREVALMREERKKF